MPLAVEGIIQAGEGVPGDKALGGEPAQTAANGRKTPGPTRAKYGSPVRGTPVAGDHRRKRQGSGPVTLGDRTEELVETGVWVWAAEAAAPRFAAAVLPAGVDPDDGYPVRTPSPGNLRGDNS